MKKLFMMAAAAALVLSSCDKGPGGNDGPINGNGEATGMKVTIKMSTAGSVTRAENFDPIDAQAEEDVLKSIDIWVFDEDGNKPDDNALHHKRFTVGAWDETDPVDFKETEVTGGGAGTGIYEMQQPWKTLSGEVRVWVAANLPDDMADDNYNTEALLLAVVDDIADLSTLTTDKGLAMFSNVATPTFELIPTGSTFEEEAADDETFNTVTIPVFRVVSKAVATNNKVASATDWAVEWTNNGGATLTYTPTHWRVMQYAYVTYDAPWYDVAKYNAVYPDGGNVRPVTYAQIVGEHIADYDRSVLGKTGEPEDGTATEIYFGANTNDDVLSANMPSVEEGENMAIYIGENSRIGAENALNENTTFAYISTGVAIDKYAAWDDDEDTLVWKNYNDWTTTPETYGFESEDDTTLNEDIIVIHWNGAEYMIPATADVLPTPAGDGTDDGLQAIINAIAANKGKMVLADQDAIDAAILLWKQENPDLEYPTNYTGPTMITMAEFKTEESFATYTYKQGYVHFLHWINPYNNVRNNHYEILRNQFIHLDVTGMSDENDGHFPGYPGDPDHPRIPIDPTEDPNNPDPLDPKDPVDPAPTDVLIHVEVMPWTYRVNDIKLGS